MCGEKGLEWPRNKAARKQRFTLKRGAHWRRKNYDLHNVLGFYMTAIALILAFTGLVWGFQWFAKGVHTLAGGDKSLVYADPVSDAAAGKAALPQPAIDAVWRRMQALYPRAEALEVHPPETGASPVAANLETVALRWLLEALGLPPEAGGSFVSGATMANFSGLAAAVHSGRILPVLCGSAVRHLGIQSLLEAIVRYLPAPTQAQADPFAQAAHPNGSTPVSRQGLPEEKFSALVFKTIIDPFMGRLTYIRVCSGSLQADTPVFNASRQVRERGLEARRPAHVL